jgi:hypothetical protein
MKVSECCYYMHFHYYCLAEWIWKVHIFRHLCMHWENFIRIGITVLYLKSCRCQLWIWWSQISVLLAPFRVCYSLDIVSTERYIYSTCIYCWNVATYNCKVTIVSFLVVCSFFHLRILITPLVSSNSSLKLISSICLSCWLTICYVCWMCFATESRHFDEYQLCLYSCWLVPLFEWGRLHTRWLMISVSGRSLKIPKE